MLIQVLVLLKFSKKQLFYTVNLPLLTQKTFDRLTTL